MMWGPRGWVARADVQKLLHRAADYAGDGTESHAHIVGLPYGALRDLLVLVPELGQEHHNDAPSIEELVAYGDDGWLFFGYVIGTCRDDERLSIDAVSVPVPSLAAMADLLWLVQGASNADLAQDGDSDLWWLGVWWD